MFEFFFLFYFYIFEFFEIFHLETFWLVCWIFCLYHMFLQSFFFIFLYHYLKLFKDIFFSFFFNLWIFINLCFILLLNITLYIFLINNTHCVYFFPFCSQVFSLPSFENWKEHDGIIIKMNDSWILNDKHMPSAGGAQNYVSKKEKLANRIEYSYSTVTILKKKRK